ncbi:MAG: hypothetical protein DRR08_03170 [Candidatus Parabeggiatoa sp. nov. 2]|nr:MAG: hypothetical protein B6247_19850 [Beggiatoa sp. 4572_84]RKZ63524.1 MAG: hypothetical protein DRR08_03170 [Gammaproteobacteria bacterium]
MRRTPMQNLFKSLILLLTLAILVNGCSTESPLVKSVASPGHVPSSGDADGFLIVDCLLPSQVRQLEPGTISLTQRRPIKTSISDCEIRGGEYVVQDRSDYAAALKVWLAKAKAGDPKAQTYVGEIYEKGLGVPPDYEKAAQWYQKAAAQGYASAQMDLGFLYERGLGVKQDSAMAEKWYRQAAELTEEADIELVAPTQSSNECEEVARLRQELEETKPLVAPVQSSNECEEVARLRQALEQTKQKVAELQNKLQMHERGAKRRHSKNKRRETGSNKLPLGTYHALIIGNNQYQHLSKLKTAVNDAKVVDELLRTRYGYKTTVLLNANRYQILNALNQLRQRLTEKDNLLIYYGGHGELDEVNQRGHWLAVDAEPDSTANWISNITITDILNTMSSKHILVVSDSCYSGTMTRSSLTRLEAGMTPEKHLKWIKKMLKKQSRTALTSGGIKPVLDTGGGQHSIFAKAFIDTLENNTEIMAAYKVYRQVAALVNDAAAATRFDQVPEYAPIRYAKHEAGEFFFVPKGASTKIAVLGTDAGVQTFRFGL